MKAAAVVVLVGACGRWGFEARDDGGLVDGAPITAAPAHLAIGDAHTCAIRGGALYCWGLNNAGQCGVGSTATQLVPARVGTDADWTWISASNENTCGVRAGALYCWGQNSAGEVGIGPDAGDVLSPARVGTSSTWLSVELGEHQACGLQLDGSVWCWGSNDMGEIGVPGPTRQRTPLMVAIGDGWRQLLVGYKWGAAVGPGGYLMWGSNEEGQRGDGSMSGTNIAPSAVELGFAPASIVGGDEHVCAIDGGGGVRCWGDNRAGQLASGTPPNDTYAPALAAVPVSPRLLALGGYSTCAITQLGALLCWGSNDFGELGNGITGVDTSVPTAVGPATDWTAVAIGLDHACGERGGALYCWGRNNDGQLGLGTQGDPVPTPTTPLAF